MAWLRTETLSTSQLIPWTTLLRLLPPVTNIGLAVAIKSLPLVESLDISNTRVDNILPLLKCKDRLKTLIMYNLNSLISEELIGVLRELNELRILDVANERDMENETRILGTEVAYLLDACTHSMPHLQYLDISNRAYVRYEIDGEVLRHFIDKHKQLKFLGLVHFRATSCQDYFLNPSNKSYRPDLLVSGTATESQLVDGLKRYMKRPVHMYACLFYMLQLVWDVNEVRTDLIRIVLNCMRSSRISDVHMASAFCLHFLTKDALIYNIHVSLLREMYDACNAALKAGPTVSLRRQDRNNKHFLVDFTSRILEQIAQLEIVLSVNAPTSPSQNKWTLRHRKDPTAPTNSPPN